MDSLTQAVLGAAVGESVLGRKIGNRAVLWGGVCGTLPDLDVFLLTGDAVSQFTYHRGPSHSLFLLALLTPIVVWLIQRLETKAELSTAKWYAAIYLVFATHVLLDAFTVYGTQLLWPLDVPPISWSTIFIIDPLYTAPMFIGLILALALTRQNNRGHLASNLGLAVSSLYLTWTLGAKLHVEAVVDESLAAQGINNQLVLTTPTPFNSLLWRIVVMDDEHYYEGYHSLLNGEEGVRFRRFDSGHRHLKGIEDEWAVKRLQWFSHGFYKADVDNGDILITDLRMGLEPDYIFSFKVASQGNPHPKTTVPERVEKPRRFEALGWINERVWSEQETSWVDNRDRYLDGT